MTPNPPLRMAVLLDHAAAQADQAISRERLIVVVANPPGGDLVGRDVRDQASRGVERERLTVELVLQELWILRQIEDSGQCPGALHYRSIPWRSTWSAWLFFRWLRSRGGIPRGTASRGSASTGFGAKAAVRIAFVTTSYPAEPGDPSGHFVQAEARLRARAAEVTVITARHGQHRSADHWHGGQGPEHDLAADRAPHVLALDGGEAFGWPGVAARVRERPRRALGLARWIRSARAALLRHGPFDQIVAHWALPCAWPIAAGLPGRLEIVSHGGDVRALLALPASARDFVVRRVAKDSAEWRFVSRALLDDLVAGLGPTERAAVLRVARVEPCVIEVPDVRAAIAQRRAAFAHRPLYVCVGRLVGSKRVDCVIDHVAERPHPSTLIVVGDGPERPGLERHAAKRRVDARFVGKTSRPEALAWMGAADALVHASEKEGLSTVIREAHALGVRVVTLACLALAVVALVVGCTDRPRRPTVAHLPVAPPSSPLARATVASAGPAKPSAPPAHRDSIHGSDFPDGVVALTWDDGPDAHTMELARYLAGEHVAATFFVVGGWVQGLSSDPGSGSNVFQTGTHAMPVLAELTALGHRVANHTENHVLLDRVSADVVTSQLARDQGDIAPFQHGGLRFFRAPGGAWNDAARAAVDDDPVLSSLVGPVGWDFDERDWDGSLSCLSPRSPSDCEAKAPAGAARVRPEVMAARYATDIETYRHGIVLLHDRVGDVGSRYALDLARILVPRLVADGFVFAAPVLRFGALQPRPDVARSDAPWSADGPFVGDFERGWASRSLHAAPLRDRLRARQERRLRRRFALGHVERGRDGLRERLPPAPGGRQPRRAGRFLCLEDPGGAVRCALSP